MPVGKRKISAKTGTSVKRTVKTRSKAKRTTTGSKSIAAEKKRIAKKPGAFLTAKEYAPISKRTYELETKRKGSKSGYKKKNGKYYKASTIVK